MSSTSIDKKVLIKWVIVIGLSLIPFAFAISDTYSVQLQRFLFITIFAVAVLAFELLEPIAVAIILPVFWILSGTTTFAVAFSPYGTSSIWIAIGAMAFVMMIQDTGILTRLGYYIFVKVKGSFSKAMFALYIACLLVSFVSMAQAQMLCFALAYALWSTLGLKPTDRETMVLVLVTILGAIQAAVFLYCPMSVAIMNGSTQAIIPGFNLTLSEVMWYNMPVFFVSLFMIWLSLLWYKRGPKNENLATENSYVYFKNEYDKLGKIKPAEIKALLLVMFVVLTVLTQSIHGLEAVYAFLIALILGFLPGINIGKTAVIKKVPWDAIILAGSFMAIGSVGGSLGLNQIITAVCVPIVSALGEYWSVLGTTVMGTLSNFILSPFAMMAVLPAPIAQYCTAVGFDPVVHIMALYNAKDIVFFPYEYPAYLLLFSFGMISMNNFTKVCTFKAIVSLIAVVVILMPWWSIVI
ncbi:MAG: SLC13 family permease [Peptococcaceae bacterium]|nr:SLC13 family permease [Peptococcaceae bacterium]